MTTETTSPSVGLSVGADVGANTGIVLARSLKGEWLNYWRFIKRPTLPVKPTGIGIAPIAATLRLFLLDLVLMVGLILLASTAAAAGFKPPANVFDTLEWSAIFIVSAVFLIPLAEEIIFRGWLSGRPAAILSLAILGIGLPLGYWFSLDSPLVGLAVMLVALLGTSVLSIRLRRKPPFAWFTRTFRLWFWLSTVTFAALHMANYTEGALWALLPLVLPQFVSGSIFGYARVQYGLWSSVTLHTMHNGIIIGSIVSAMP